MHAEVCVTHAGPPADADQLLNGNEHWSELARNKGGHPQYIRKYASERVRNNAQPLNVLPVSYAAERILANLPVLACHVNVCPFAYIFGVSQETVQDQ